MTGDSRTIVVREGKVLFSTKDHNPNRPSERQRIEAAGGEVHSRGAYRGKIIHQVRKFGSTASGIAMSRAFGQKTGL